MTGNIGHTVILFYKYAEIEDPMAAKQEQEEFCKKLGLAGRVLISEEGINATLSSSQSSIIQEYIEFLCKHPTFQMTKDDFKHSNHDGEEPPFSELVIKYVKEIVSTGGAVDRPNMNESDAQRGYLTPEQFHEAMKQAVQNKDKHIVLDVRAHKEFLVGHFENAVDPEVKNFSEYYTFLERKMEDLKQKKVLMYCTGGIRCEKASNFLRGHGVQDVHHLKGGIHKYLEKYEDGGFFKGKNFVFDKRVLMRSQNKDIVGKCIECECPYEEFNGRKVCSVCRDLVIVCDECFFKRHGEMHCTDHRLLKDCYFTFIQYQAKDELVQNRASLMEILAEHALDKTWKNKRKTLRKQIDKITKRIEELDAAGITHPLQPGETRYIHCRTCGSSTCMGNCWGFWNEVSNDIKKQKIVS